GSSDLGVEGAGEVVVLPPPGGGFGVADVRQDRWDSPVRLGDAAQVAAGGVDEAGGQVAEFVEDAQGSGGDDRLAAVAAQFRVERVAVPAVDVAVGVEDCPDGAGRFALEVVGVPVAVQEPGVAGDEVFGGVE